METPDGLISTIILTAIGTGGGIKLLEFFRDLAKGRTEKRRTEVDNMAKLATEANLKAVAAENARDAAISRARNAEEALAEARMMLLSSGMYTRDQIPDISSD